MPLKVCYFGNYDPEYNRNRVLMRGLSQNGVTVIECNDRSSFFRRFWQLFRKHWSLGQDYDIMVVGFGGYTALPLARLITRKPVIFDAFLSLYDSNIKDRQLFRPFGPMALWYWFLDWQACFLSTAVLLDTASHAAYFERMFCVPSRKLFHFPIGADPDIFPYCGVMSPNSPLIVHFHGSYIPLQGASFIIGAAFLLRNEPFVFNLIGSGQELPAMRERVSRLGIGDTVRFIPRQSQKDIVPYLKAADVCLGMFGTSEKASRVISNKIYEYCSAGKPVLTADTPAMREYFDGQSIFFTKSGDAAILAAALRSFARTPYAEVCKRASNGYTLFIHSFTPNAIGRRFKTMLEKYV